MELIDELISYLADKKPQVRQMALQHLLGFTNKDCEQYDYIASEKSGVVKKLKILCLDNLTIAHDALKALINISSKPENCKELIDEEFIFVLVKFIMHPKCIFADLCCMLLCNLSKSPTCSKILLQSENDRMFGTYLDALVEIFCRGKSFNSQANFDFLAPIFANLALLKDGRRYLMDESRDTPLKKLIVFTEHESVIRRGGVICTLKNVAVELAYHEKLLQDQVLVKILLPLAGPEELSEEDMDGMLDELQLLEDTKTREIDANLRKNLLETLLLFATLRQGRDYMRSRKVYPIVREMHLSECDKECDLVAHDLVQMLLRDESNDNDIDIENAFAEKQDEIERELRQAIEPFC